jgi:hypothetical protein
MLSKNDIQILRGMFEENNHVLKREIRDEMHALIAASESKVIHRIELVKEEIIDGIIDTLDRDVYPRLNGHDQDIVRLKLVTGIA